jgi:hypothetical protein
MAIALSKLLNQVEPIGVLDQTTSVHLFTLEPNWLYNVYKYLIKGVMPKKFATSTKIILSLKS